MNSCAWSLEERKVDLVVAPGILGVAGPRLSIRPAEGMPLLHVERPVTTGARRILKTIVDLLIALPLAILAMPVLMVIALLVRLDSPGPVLFRQERLGLDRCSQRRRPNASKPACRHNELHQLLSSDV